MFKFITIFIMEIICLTFSAIRTVNHLIFHLSDWGDRGEGDLGSATKKIIIIKGERAHYHNIAAVFSNVHPL